MSKVKKVCHYIFFCFLLIMGLGQLPSIVGRVFLVMALLVVPSKRFQCFVDEVLYTCSKRWLWIFLFILYIFRLPMSEIDLAGKSMGKFLYGIRQWIMYALGR